MLLEQRRLCPIFCENMDPDKWDTIVWYRVTRNPQELCWLRGCQRDPWVLGCHTPALPLPSHFLPLALLLLLFPSSFFFYPILFPLSSSSSFFFQLHWDTKNSFSLNFLPNSSKSKVNFENKNSNVPFLFISFFLFLNFLFFSFFSPPPLIGTEKSPDGLC